jgi:hypothetical protein
MADITMCTKDSNNCEKADKCYRKLAKPNEHYQSYALFNCSKENNWEFFYLTIDSRTLYPDIKHNASGNYVGRCINCGDPFIGEKRDFSCDEYKVKVEE